MLNLENIRQIIAADRTILFSVPDPEDYEGETRWVFPTEVTASTDLDTSSSNLFPGLRYKCCLTNAGQLLCEGSGREDRGQVSQWGLQVSPSLQAQVWQSSGASAECQLHVSDMMSQIIYA